MQLNIGSGPDRHQVRRSFTTEKQARAFHADILGAAEAGTYVKSSVRTVEQACTEWLGSKHRLKSSTRRGYQSALQPVRDELGDVTIQKLTKRDIDDLVVRLREGKVKRADPRRGAVVRRASPRTVNQTRR